MPKLTASDFNEVDFLGRTWQSRERIWLSALPKREALITPWEAFTSTTCRPEVAVCDGDNAWFLDAVTTFTSRCSIRW